MTVSTSIKSIQDRRYSNCRFDVRPESECENNSVLNAIESEATTSKQGNDFQIN